MTDPTEPSTRSTVGDSRGAERAGQPARSPQPADPVRRLLLVRHATTRATRRAAFPATTGSAPDAACSPLDPAGVAAATVLGAHLPRADHCWTSHATRSVQTARCLGLEPGARMAELAECGFGRWAGSTLEEIHGQDPDGLAAWFADPTSSPHGGEPLASVRRRAREVLAAAAAVVGTTVAVTHGGLIRAALLEVLDLPAAGVWRLDCAPASVTELHLASDGWRLVRVNWSPRPAAWRTTAEPTGGRIGRLPAAGGARTAQPGTGAS